jgi:hypothetical protein
MRVAARAHWRRDRKIVEKLDWLVAPFALSPAYRVAVYRDC